MPYDAHTHRYAQCDLFVPTIEVGKAVIKMTITSQLKQSMGIAAFPSLPVMVCCQNNLTAVVFNLFQLGPHHRTVIRHTRQPFGVPSAPQPDDHIIFSHFQVTGDIVGIDQGAFIEL
jgi:hypothetical protein